MPFIDVLASCDVLLTKPGYGAFTEAVCNGVSVLYVARRDWPEEPYLVAWLQQFGQCQEIQPRQLEAGDFGAELALLLGSLPRRGVEFTGAAAVAEVLASYLIP